MYFKGRPAVYSSLLNWTAHWVVLFWVYLLALWQPRITTGRSTNWQRSLLVLPLFQQMVCSLHFSLKGHSILLHSFSCCICLSWACSTISSYTRKNCAAAVPSPLFSNSSGMSAQMSISFLSTSESHLARVFLLLVTIDHLILHFFLCTQLKRHLRLPLPYLSRRWYGHSDVMV